ncbi:Uncharacterised protein [BD1-7 clade bacterium]|uniref:Uncharacterized protein n=1 Tax=BD1-7 clade bacterium TaxID=2029982 RepID=A0A5S9NNL5_9GAMM|nr:Uncharacterised protein [BD1-7 clade bacterium]
MSPPTIPIVTAILLVVARGGVMKIGLTCFFMFAALHAIAQECHEAYKPAVSHLQSVEEQLHRVTNKNEYQRNVRERYDTIELLGFVAEACANEKTLTALQRDRWLQMRDVLLHLRASARASAFTKFSDWIASKNEDLNACLLITNASVQVDKE